MLASISARPNFASCMGVLVSGQLLFMLTCASDKGLCRCTSSWDSSLTSLWKVSTTVSCPVPVAGHDQDRGVLQSLGMMEAAVYTISAVSGINV